MTALDLCERADLDEEARKLATEDIPVRTYIEQLTRRERLRDSIAALAQVLPNVDSIAWGLHSVRRVTEALSGPKAETISY